MLFQVACMHVCVSVAACVAVCVKLSAQAAIL